MVWFRKKLSVEYHIKKCISSLCSALSLHEDCERSRLRKLAGGGCRQDTLSHLLERRLTV
jgi:hypothetical protein